MNAFSADDEDAEGSDWDDKTKTVLEYLQIREVMKTTAAEDENGLSAEAAMQVADLREIYFRALDLLRRLGRSYSKDLDLESRAMYFDMCTYLCGLVKKLHRDDILSAADLEADDGGSAINAAPVFLESLPYSSRL